MKTLVHSSTNALSLESKITYIEHFLGNEQAQAYYQQLLREVSFCSEIYVFNEVAVQSRRKVAYHSEFPYSYSNQAYAGTPWTPTLALLRTMVNEATGHDFNAVLCNWYEDGSASMGWHTDSEKELGPDPVIASLSFGQRRTFAFRPKRTKLDKNPEKVGAYHLGEGDLLVMGRGIQNEFEHALLPEKKVALPRMNLTFRHIMR